MDIKMKMAVLILEQVEQAEHQTLMVMEDQITWMHVQTNQKLTMEF